jgi:hypothetical protein
MRRLLIILVILACASPAWGAKKYLNVAQTTADSTGASWTNAYNSAIKAVNSLVRDDTLLVADGDYTNQGNLELNKVVSSNLRITLMKATVASHGTETGWDNAFGDGQAVFVGFTITRSNYTIDGNGTTTSPDSTCAATGFRINVGVSGIGVYFRSHDWGTSAAAPDSCTVKYVDIFGDAKNRGETAEAGVKTYPTVPSGETYKGITVSNCWIHDIDVCTFTPGACEYFTIERNWFCRNWTITGQNYELIADYGGNYFTVRYNVLTDAYSSGFIVPMHNHTASTTTIGWQIYGNLLFNTYENPYEAAAGVTIGYDDPDTPGFLYQDNKIYNNTFINIKTGVHRGIKFPANTSSSGNEVWNNLWYDCGSIYLFPSRGTVYNYNAYIGTSLTPDAGYIHTVSDHDDSLGLDENLFVDYANYDFRLSKEAGVISGRDLAAPFNTDLLGHTRTTPYISKGAFEFDYDGEEAAPVYNDLYFHADSTGVGTPLDPIGSLAVLADSTRTGSTINLMSDIIGLGAITIASGKDSVRVQTDVAKSSPAVISGRRPVKGLVHSAGSSTVKTDSTDVNSTELWYSGYIFDAADYVVGTGYNRQGGGNRVAAYGMRIRELDNFQSFTSIKFEFQSFYDNRNNNGVANLYVRVENTMAATAPTNYATLRSKFENAVADSVGPWTILGDDNVYYTSGELLPLFEDLTFDGDANVLLFVSGAASNVFLSQSTESAVYTSKLIFSYNSGTVVTLPDSIYARAVTSFGDSLPTKIWMGGRLLEKKADGATLTGNSWCTNAAKDTVFVWGTLAQMDSLEADMLGPLIQAAGANFTAANLILRHSNKSGVRVSGADALIANSLFDSSAVGGSAVGNGSQWVNNIFRAIADSALAVYGTSVTNTTNAYVTGSNTTGLTTPLELVSYDPAEPPQTVNGVGTDVGFGNDIGPVSVADLIASEAAGYTRRRVFDSGPVPTYNGGPVPTYEP